MRIDQIAIWEAFVSVANHGHFSKAAESLHLPVPQVSKRVSKLEDLLGVRLFQRTTRSVSLTDEGRSLLPKVNSILEDLHEAESLFENKGQLTGTIKITCVPFIAHRLLLPVLQEFKNLHPELQIQLDLSETKVNLIESGFDLAIRIETPKDSELVYRPLVPNDLLFCASPEYLKKNKRKIKNPTELKHHEMLVLGIHKRCRFKNSQDKLGDFIANQQVICENGTFLTEMALQGMGILVRSVWDIQGHMHAGRLVQVLKNFPLETFGQVYAVVPSRRFLAPRVRHFLDFLVEHSKSWKL